ncbi:MAG: cysteine methyltransferase [Betaproteobacteria bacterium HGW-Betaproteobacteria-10]|nr:MAG: cysteine methyltransferase [Betaproteobacteria bacterium HGW-Betaproteobacteria-10]
MNQSIYQSIVAAPGFALGIRCTEDEISAIDFLEPRPAQAPTNLLAAEAVRQLHAYLTNPACPFSLPLRPVGTPFQRRVWAEINAIPLGQTDTYGQLAKNLKNAPRAVGQACGANPYPLIVPCHRVIAAGGGLGGFNRQGGGFLLEVKRWLLQHENCLSG